MGDHPPLQALRSAQLQPRGGGRQPDEAYEYRHAAAQRAAVPPRAHRGDDRPHGRGGKRAISPKGNRGAACIGRPPPLPLDRDGAGSRTAVRAGVSFVFRFCTGDCKTGKPMVQ